MNSGQSLLPSSIRYEPYLCWILSRPAHALQILHRHHHQPGAPHYCPHKRLEEEDPSHSCCRKPTFFFISPTDGPQLSDIPFRILAATEKDGFRKPIPGMWYELERIWAENNVQIGMPRDHRRLPPHLAKQVILPDFSQSFFIGDAAGRKDDHSSTDRKLALNIGIPFLTPEVRHLFVLFGSSLTLPSGILPGSPSRAVHPAWFPSILPSI